MRTGSDPGTALRRPISPEPHAAHRQPEQPSSTGAWASAVAAGLRQAPSRGAKLEDVQPTRLTRRDPSRSRHRAVQLSGSPKVGDAPSFAGQDGAPRLREAARLARLQGRQQGGRDNVPLHRRPRAPAMPITPSSGATDQGPVVVQTRRRAILGPSACATDQRRSGPSQAACNTRATSATTARPRRVGRMNKLRASSGSCTRSTRSSSSSAILEREMTDFDNFRAAAACRVVCGGGAVITKARRPSCRAVRCPRSSHRTTALMASPKADMAVVLGGSVVMRCEPAAREHRCLIGPC